MNWDILEAYIVTLFEMVLTGDLTCYDAIRKYKAFSKDIRKSCDITPLNK